MEMAFQRVRLPVISFLPQTRIYHKFTSKCSSQSAFPIGHTKYVFECKLQALSLRLVSAHNSWAQSQL